MTPPSATSLRRRAALRRCSPDGLEYEVVAGIGGDDLTRGPDAPAAAARSAILPIDDLMAQMIDRAEEIISAQQRLRQLISANRAIISSELSLPAVLHTIVAAARDLIGARYAALGVIAADGSLEQFIHSGMSESIVESIGALPKGKGLLGALIADPEPIRLPKISDDPRSSGFPTGHPPMDSFLGVPIRSRNEVFGNLYLTGPRGGEFTGEDEELLLALASTAGVAIENARLYEESQTRQQWLLASAEIGSVLLSPDGDRHPLQLIVDAVKRLADADVVTLVVPADDAGMLRVAVAAGEGQAELRGLHYPVDDTLVALAMDTGRGVRVGSLDHDQQYRVHLSRAVDVGAVMAVPLSGAAGPQGAIMAGRRKGRQNTTADLDMAEVFANHAAIARELVEARGGQQRLAVLEDRARIARDLHDHVIQRLFAAGLSVQSVATVLGDTDIGVRLGRIVADIDDTIRQVRTSIFQLDSVDEVGSGARTAVLAVVGQVTPTLGFEPAVRFDGPVDTLVPEVVLQDIRAVVGEALTNVVKHANATEVTVQLSVADGILSVTVLDNGIGLSQSSRRSGLANLERRAEHLDGTLEIDAGQEGGTTLRWTIPMPR
jgi:signal transduction histidine kinase